MDDHDAGLLRQVNAGAHKPISWPHAPICRAPSVHSQCAKDTKPSLTTAHYRDLGVASRAQDYISICMHNTTKTIQTILKFSMDQDVQEPTNGQRFIIPRPPAKFGSKKFSKKYVQTVGIYDVKKKMR